MEIQKYQIYIQYNQNILEKYRKPNFEKPKKKEYNIMMKVTKVTKVNHIQI